jgi:hypothetical protein
MTQRWWKNIAGQEHRQRGGHIVADQVSVFEFGLQLDSAVQMYIDGHL